MPSSATLLTLASAISSATAAYQGFNYGSTFTDGSAKSQSDFEADFKTAASLDGTDNGFTSARLYTMVQAGTANDPISAIPAAISTKTSLLFGLWASGGQEAFNNELAALQKTIDQYCDKLDGLVAGISVGSEDLYRNSPTGIAANENPGVDPDVIAKYIKETRKAIKGSCLSDAPIGHVDTWTVYVNGSNQAVLDAVDWVGMDAYAYFESTKDNPIENGKSLFLDALSQTKNAAGGKPVWITETGWPVSGKTVGKGVPSKENAKTFWDEVGCPMFGKTNVWWFTLQDSAPDTPNPSFGIIGSELSKKPIYDLSCKNVKPNDPSTSKAPVSETKTKTNNGGDSTTPVTTAPETESTSQAAATTTSAAGEETTSAPAPPSTTTSAAAGGDGGAGGENTSGAANPPSVSTKVSPPETTPDTGAGGQPADGGDDGNSAPATPSATEPPASNGQVLNSMGAAAVAVLLAAAAL